jgi:hypothetical protein
MTYSMSSHAWYGSFTTTVAKSQIVSEDPESILLQETDDIAFTGMPFMSTMQVISHWRIISGELTIAVISDLLSWWVSQELPLERVSSSRCAAAGH